MPQTYDSIIIGQGLAGSILAYNLIKGGQSVLVIDNQHQGSSSKVAAGIINPITGYRLITNILFSKQRECSLNLYRELEALLDQKLVSELNQFRLLKSEEQVSFWKKRQTHATYSSYAGDSLSALEPFLENEFGVAEIHKTLRIHTSELLHNLKNWLIDKNSYLAKKIDYHSVQVSQSKVSIDNLKSNRIIFCEGYQVTHNPWWKHLPFKLSKGEILKVELDKPINEMLNWRQWLVPESENDKQALLGANYEWGDFEKEDACQVTDEAKDYLLMRLQTNTHLQAKVLEQYAGIRPTPTHRYPYIGSHRNASNVYCFNGFGSKGCLTIPYYSDLLTNHIINNTSLPEDVTRWL